MTTWGEVTRFFEENFGGKPVNDDGTVLKTTLPVSADRTQALMLKVVDGLLGDQWVVIQSGIAMRGGVDLDPLIEMAGRMPIGGIVAVGDAVGLRHSAPLESMQLEQLGQQVMAILSGADALETLSTGADDF